MIFSASVTSLCLMNALPRLSPCTFIPPTTFRRDLFCSHRGQLGSAQLIVTVPAGSRMCSVSVLPPYLQMSPSCTALFRPFDMTLPYGPNWDKEPPLQFTEFINNIGRKGFCGASESFFKILAPYALPHASKPPSGGADILERISQILMNIYCFLKDALRAKSSIILKGIRHRYYALQLQLRFTTLQNMFSCDFVLSRNSFVLFFYKSTESKLLKLLIAFSMYLRNYIKNNMYINYRGFIGLERMFLGPGEFLPFKSAVS